MKLKSLVLAAAVLVTGLAIQHSAEARGLTKADRAVVKQTMYYVGQMATILEKNADKPKVLLAKLERFVKVKGPRVRKLGAKMKKMEQELDANAKAQLKKEFESNKSLKRFTSAMMAVGMKQKDNQAFQQDLMRVMMKLQPNGAKKAPKKAAPKK